jgi:fucose permease
MARNPTAARDSVATLLLVIIYIAFISLGLPDALLGAGWPVMQSDLAVPYGYAGIVSMVISCGTIVSSVFSSRVIKRFGIGKVTATSVGATALGLLGFASTPSFWWLLLAALPLGIGGGAVDAALNAYVARHYESRHMSWLHSFWGVGALSGPLVLSALFSRGFGWRAGYLLIAIFQVALAISLILAIPLWDRARAASATDATPETPHRALFFPLRLRGAKLALLAFFCYCGVEGSMGLWGGSYLFKVKGIEAAAAATWVSLFYLSITGGRFLTGFITYRISNKDLIRYGGLIVLAGVTLMLLPLPLPLALAGFLMVGFGCAPIFPCMLHETPARFGSTHAQAIMGFQTAVAYTGATLLPPAFGFIASATSLRPLPIFLAAYIVCLILCSEGLRRRLPRA